MGRSVVAAADPAQPYGAALPWPKRANGRAARVAGAFVVTLDGDAALFVERGGRHPSRSATRDDLARPGARGARRARAPLRSCEPTCGRALRLHPVGETKSSLFSSKPASRRPAPGRPPLLVVPEGDALHRVAAAQAPAARRGRRRGRVAQPARAAPRRRRAKIDGRRLERVEGGRGRTSCLTFDGNLVLRSHLRMKGRSGACSSAGAADLARAVARPARPRSSRRCSGAGRLLELTRGRARIHRLGPDVMHDPPDLDGIDGRPLPRHRSGPGARRRPPRPDASPRGSGTSGRPKGLHRARLSPRLRLRDVDRRGAPPRPRRERAPRCGAASRGRSTAAPAARVPSCGTKVESWPQGDDARLAYWCPSCQPGPRATGRR